MMERRQGATLLSKQRRIKLQRAKKYKCSALGGNPSGKQEMSFCFTLLLLGPFHTLGWDFSISWPLPMANESLISSPVKFPQTPRVKKTFVTSRETESPTWSQAYPRRVPQYPY